MKRNKARVCLVFSETEGWARKNVITVLGLAQETGQNSSANCVQGSKSGVLCETVVLYFILDMILDSPWNEY
jgi:hypothetical protein